MGEGQEQIACELKRIYEQTVDALQEQRRNLLDDFDFYEGKHWPEALKKQLESEGKPAHVFNWAQNEIIQCLGELDQQPLGIRFVRPGIGAASDGDLMQALYDMDYERGRFQAQFDAAIRDGLISQGCVQFIFDDKDDPFGNVGIVQRNPKHIVHDAYWTSGDIEHCQRIFSYTWMTAEQISNFYRNQSEEVLQAIARWDKEIQTHSPEWADRTEQFYDSDGPLYKVIECFWMEHRDERTVIDLSDASEVSEVDLKSLAMLSDNLAQDVISRKNPSWQLIYRDKAICRFSAIVPALDSSLLLENGDYPIQLGHVPFRFFWYLQENEYRSGLIAKVKGANLIYDKRQSLVSHALGSSTGAGNYLAESDAFGGDKKLQKDFENRVTKTGQLLFVAPGALSGGVNGNQKKIIEMQRGTVPLDVLRTVADMKDDQDALAMLPRAIQGRSEKVDESGKLFQSKVLQANIGLEQVSKSVKEFLQGSAKDYAKAAKQVYRGPQRKFIDSKTNQEFFVNRVIRDESGKVQRINFIDELPDYMVRVEEKRTGKSKRNEEMQTLSELLPGVRNPALQAAIESRISANLDLPEDETLSLQKASDEWLQLQLENIRMQRQQVATAMKAAASPQAQQGAAQQAVPAR